MTPSAQSVPLISPVTADQARVGDVFVRDGHAGIVVGIGNLGGDPSGNLVSVVWQNGGNPGPNPPYRNGSTGQWIVGAGSGAYYRQLVNVQR